MLSPVTENTYSNFVFFFFLFLFCPFFTHFNVIKRNAIFEIIDHLWFCLSRAVFPRLFCLEDPLRIRWESLRILWLRNTDLVQCFPDFFALRILWGSLKILWLRNTVFPNLFYSRKHYWLKNVQWTLYKFKNCQWGSINIKVTRWDQYR